VYIFVYIPSFAGGNIILYGVFDTHSLQEPIDSECL